jgi:hypothetical protein
MEAFSFVLICLCVCLVIILKDISQELAEIKIALRENTAVVDEAGRCVRGVIGSKPHIPLNSFSG